MPERRTAAALARATALSCRCQRTRCFVFGSIQIVEAGKTNCQQNSRLAAGALRANASGNGAAPAEAGILPANTGVPDEWAEGVRRQMAHVDRYQIFQCG